jgi:hypothetical protein
MSPTRQCLRLVRDTTQAVPGTAAYGRIAAALTGWGLRPYTGAMISLSKLILLVLVVLAVWFGWRWISRVEQVGRERLQRRQADPPPTKGDGGTDRADKPTAPGNASAWGRGRPPSRPAEDMEKCLECGVYVAPTSATSCGRPGCPYGRR